MVIRLLRTLFPSARRALSWRDGMIVGICLLTFGGGLAWGISGRHISFGRPWAFSGSALVVWFWWMHVTGFHGLHGARSALAQVMRYGLILVLVALLAEPRTIRENDDLSVVYVLDVSDSVGKTAISGGLEYMLRTAKDRPQGDRVGLIILGGEAAVELPPTAAFPFEAINVEVPRDATDLGKGLALATAMVPIDTPGRVVLISDGVDTAGDPTGMLDELKARGVPVDVLPVQYDFGEEVWIDRLQLPRIVKRGETYEAAVVLSSLQEGSGELVLFENGEEIARQLVTYRAGKNRFTMPIYLRTAGYYEYKAVIMPPEGRDGRKENNIGIGYLFLRGERKVLLVTDPMAEDDRDYSHLLTALGDARIETTVKTAFELPYDPVEYMPYDCIVLCNVPGDTLDHPQMRAVQQAVFRQGQGLLMIGGENSFGPGGYQRTPIEEALPVTMDITMRRVMPKAALAVVLHTCEFPSGNTWGKNITKEAIRVLGKQDEACVLVYDYNGGVKFLFELTPVSEFESMVKKIEGAQIGDMPSFAPTMELGLKELVESDAAARHMIVISDGDPQPPAPKIMDQFVANKISITTVAVFPHGNMDMSMMKSIASTTGGRYYFPQDANLLPSIFIKEAKTLRRSMIQNKTFVPDLHSYSPILKGIEALHPLHGYTLVTPKDLALTVLRGPDKEALDPVLSVWRHGAGQSAVFTSDLTAQWAREWVGAEYYQQFIKQLFENISRVQRPSNLQIATQATGTTGVIWINDHHQDAGFLDLAVSVNGPREYEATVSMRQVGPGRYQGQFPLIGEGRYHIAVSASSGDRSELEVASLIQPYSPEYLRFRSDSTSLERIARRTGGAVLMGDESSIDLFPPVRSVRRTTQLSIDWFLIALTILLTLDVAARRVQIDFCQWLPGRKKGHAHTPTLGSLLERKQQISHTQTRSSRPAAQSRSPRSDQEPRKAESAASPEGQQAEPPDSTTGQLLARKRRWDQDNED